jgi:RNA methyltransferase, TrmH family
MPTFDTHALKLIESPANPLIRVLANLKTTKARRENRQILIESLHPVEEALEAGLSITHLLLRDDRADTLYNTLAQRFETQLDEINDILRVSEAAMARIATTDSAPEILAIADTPHLAQTLETDQSTLALYNVQDPGNIGTLIRSALAFGVTQIAFIGNHHADPYQPKIIRASAGLIFKTTCALFETLDALALPSDVPIIGLDANGETALGDFTWPKASVILLGSEGGGLPQFQSGIPLTTLHIPMAPEAESLNVAIAGSIVLHAHYQACQIHITP